MSENHMMGRLIVFLWRQLTVLNVLAIMLFVYAGFYFGTVARFHDADLRAKMLARAEVALLKADTKADAKAKAEALIANLKARNFHFDPATTSPDSHTISMDEARFLHLITKMAMAEPGTKKYSDLSEKLGVESQSKSLEKNNFGDWLGAEWERFSSAKHSRDGLEFDFRNSEQTRLREDAQLFLNHHDIFEAGASRFWKGFNRAPLSVKVMPWSLIRFNDERRYKLNATIPFALGTLLLACGFLLQFRLIDYLPSKGGRGMADRKEGWIPVWKSSVDDLQKDLSRWSPRWMPLVLIACLLTATFIELRLNDPQIRQEWIWNLPMMLMAALSIPIICYTLHDLSKQTFNLDLAILPTDTLTLLLRPLILGSSVLCAAVAWSILFSIFELPGTVSQTIRASGQILIGAVILWFLLQMLLKINSDYRNLKRQQLKNAADQKPDVSNTNREEKDILDEFIPGLDARMARACALAILPLPAIIDALIN